MTETLANSNSEIVTSTTETNSKRSRLEPISVFEASQICREIDGLEPGSINYGTEYDILSSFDALESFYGAINLDLYSFNIGEIDEIKNNLSKYDNQGIIFQLNYLSDLHKLIEFSYHGSRNSKDEDSTGIPTMDYVGSTLSKYLEYKTDTDAKDGLRTFGHLKDFLHFYNSEFKIYVKGDNKYNLDFSTEIQKQRNELIQQVTGNDFDEILGYAQRARILEEIRQAPIIIADPLTSAMNDKHDWTYGWFNALNRTININIMPTEKNSSELMNAHEPDLELTKNYLKAHLRSTVYHELFHSTNSFRYSSEKQVDKYGEFKTIRAYSFWPKFICEGITEKLAYFAFSKITPDFSSQIKDHKDENFHRSMLRLSENELLGDEDTTRSKQVFESYYGDYRLAIDLLLDRLDWKKAGMSQEEAQKLLISAVLENDDTVDRKNKYPKRRAFNRAVSKAGHPGMINKLDMLDALIGPDRIVNILSSSRFNPHDATALPWLIDRNKYSRLQQSLLEINNLTYRHKSYTTDSDLWNWEATEIEDILRQYDEQVLLGISLEKAVEDMDAELLSRFGKREIIKRKIPFINTRIRYLGYTKRPSSNIESRLKKYNNLEAYRRAYVTRRNISINKQKNIY
jgi:hypothetical protein